MVAKQVRKKPSKLPMYKPMTPMAAVTGNIIKPILSHPR